MQNSSDIPKPPLDANANKEPKKTHFTKRYAVLVEASDEEKQRAFYEGLRAVGVKSKVVNT